MILVAALGTSIIESFASIPTNLGAGPNQDPVIVARMSELFLFEGQVRTRALLEVLSNTLLVRLQVRFASCQNPRRSPDGR